jgi:hypothetical protein
MPKEVLFHLEDPAVVIAAGLDGRFPHFLLAPRHLMAALQHQDAQLGIGQEELARQRKAGEAGSENQDVAVMSF